RRSWHLLLAKRAHLNRVDGEAPGRVTSKPCFPAVAGARSLRRAARRVWPNCAVRTTGGRRHYPAISPSTASPEDEEDQRMAPDLSRSRASALRASISLICRQRC